jgi:type VI secretion system protein ImpJ
MYLGPHQFQAQSAYFESVIDFSGSALWFEPYGFLSYELDEEALRNDTVSLLHARGIFPDGMPFQLSERDDRRPVPRAVTNLFPPTQDRLLLSLAVPAYKPSGVNCAVTDDGVTSWTRYVPEERLIFDENTGQDQKPVNLGRKNIRLIFETEPSDGLVMLPLARIARDGAGHFVYDERFIPPCLDIVASERLMGLTRRLIGILSEKGAALSGGSGRRLASGLSSHQVASYWFLHAVVSALASLRHICFSRHGHPELLYAEMLRLGGALCTFGLGAQPGDLPLYDHWSLEECFESLDRHIREHLELQEPSNCVPIALQPTAKYFYSGAVTDSRCLGRSRWIFAINSPMGEASLITSTPRRVKICSSRFIPELVKRALPGLELTHLPTPPAAVSPRPTSQYFSVTKSGPCWDHIVETRQVSVYVPGDIPNAEMELLVILDS